MEMLNLISDAFFACLLIQLAPLDVLEAISNWFARPECLDKVIRKMLEMPKMRIWFLSFSCYRIFPGIPTPSMKYLEGF